MLKFIHTKKIDIFTQLKREETLLKTSKDSFCIINEGTSPAIVLGISNKPKDLISTDRAKKDKVPLIKRFSGGGTVFVDGNTIFVTFIFSKDFLKIDLFPEPIMRWAEKFYKKVFKQFNFSLIENDFVINNKKIAGNAKYIKKDRFLLHTSFLLDYNKEKMNKYLLLPQRTPAYRNKRSHIDFLTTLKSYLSKDAFIKSLKNQLKSSFKIDPINFLDIQINKIEHSTQLI